MPVSLSKTEICSFVGDVLPLYLSDGERDLSGADIRWRIEGDAARLRGFDKDPLSPFCHGVLLSLCKVGVARVYADCEGQTYLCDIRVRERKTAHAKDPLCYYRGDLHTHTVSTHTPEKFAALSHPQKACIDTLSGDTYLDFGILSDHASVMRRRGFFEEFVELENTPPSNTVILPGSESEVTVLETDRFGLPHKHSGEIVVWGADNCSSVKSWEEFEADMAKDPPPVGIFAHPFVLGVGQNSLWSYPFAQLRTPFLLSLMRGIEMGAGRPESGSILFEYAYSAALDAGFSVSPTCGSDCHGPQWGFGAMPGKTVLMASKKSREAFLDAMRAGRFYACESGNVKLSFTVNGERAPATLPLTDTYRFSVQTVLFDEIADTRPCVCEVISDGGKILYTCNIPGNGVEFTLSSGTARYFYLRLRDEKGRKTWSSPVWTGRAFEAPKAAENALIPQNGCDFTATELQTGADAAAVIDGDPHTAFESALPTTSILIDMKKEREISALGYFARRFTKDWIKATSVDWKAEISGRVCDIVKRYVTRYEIATSLDGVHFTTVKSGAIRAFGDEEIFRFPTHGARFLRFDALSTVGNDSGIPALAKSPVAIGELTVFGEV